jgi:hypothetical protein
MKTIIFIIIFLFLNSPCEAAGWRLFRRQPTKSNCSNGQCKQTIKPPITDVDNTDGLKDNILNPIEEKDVPVSAKICYALLDKPEICGTITGVDKKIKNGKTKYSMW